MTPHQLPVGHWPMARSGTTCCPYPSVLGRFASLPQPDLMLTIASVESVVFRQGDFVRLEPDQVDGVADLRSPAA